VRHVNILCLDNTSIIPNVPVVSIFAAITGTPDHLEVECGNLNSRTRDTSDREERTDRLGLINTSLKSNLTSFSIFIIVLIINIRFK
jgi:hypothetical protein